MEITKAVEIQYGRQLRQRICGICIKADKVLLVRHQGLGAGGIFWAPPGGGMEYGSSVHDNLKREFLEETGLQVEIQDFLFVHEYLKPPLHALEIFFNVKMIGGYLQTGTDPESPADAQLIQDVSFLSWEQIKMIPAGNLHQILQHSSSLQDLKSKRGYYKFSV